MPVSGSYCFPNSSAHNRPQFNFARVQNSGRLDVPRCNPVLIAILVGEDRVGVVAQVALIIRYDIARKGRKLQHASKRSRFKIVRFRTEGLDLCLAASANAAIRGGSDTFLFADIEDRRNNLIAPVKADIVGVPKLPIFHLRSFPYLSFCEARVLLPRLSKYSVVDAMGPTIRFPAHLLRIVSAENLLPLRYYEAPRMSRARPKNDPSDDKTLSESRAWDMRETLWLYATHRQTRRGP